jgi:hypothetical protein
MKGRNPKITKSRSLPAGTADRRNGSFESKRRKAEKDKLARLKREGANGYAARIIRDLEFMHVDGLEPDLGDD